MDGLVIVAAAAIALPFLLGLIAPLNLAPEANRRRPLAASAFHARQQPAECAFPLIRLLSLAV